MASVNSLLAAGLPPLAARLLGVEIVTLAGTGTAQSGGTAIGNVTCVLANSLSGQTAYVLPTSADLGHVVEFYNVGDTAARLFPHSGGTIEDEAADAVRTVAAGTGVRLRRVTSSKWMTVLGDQA